MNLANWITVSRFCLVPFIFWQLSSGTRQGVFIALGLLLFAAITDVADGWVARARKEITELGKTLDPLGDKLVILGTLVALVVAWGFPLWVAGVYLLKEVFQMFAGLILIRKYRQLISANWWGKSATVGFFVGFGVFFLHPLTGIFIIGVAVALSFYAGYTYYLAAKKLEN
ncbi:MAG TPA: CDP-alcohol phosphatidyltransferase family protein [Bacillota bacterium]|nr:CDP-alcohol phosphatidyltransferase family protein [Bacillota bacterium]